jgi:ribulose 1,5-bisphosphate synthetase/thiazole synthase
MREYLQTDVLVVGGGPAGIGAALGAARRGVKTLLLENQGFFGGIASFCRGMPMNQMRPAGRPRSQVHELLIGKLLSYGPQAARLGQHEVWCNIEYLAVAILDALEEAGVKYLVHTRAVDALVEGERVTGVVVATKNGLAAIRAKVTVDCTGDADVAFFAGAETMKETGALSPMTMCFNVTNVDMAKARRLYDFPREVYEEYPLLPNPWWANEFTSENTLYVNHSGTKTLGVFDGTDPEQITRAEALSRRQALHMVAAMRAHGGEGLERAELIAAGAQVGVRETRRVKGCYALTEEDALAGRSFEDRVAWRSGFLDIGFVRYERMKVHDVPYRALLPEKLDGLLAAGRCISATHVAASAGKSMGNCLATGHAAGLAAALSIQAGVLPRDLRVPQLQAALREDGVDLERAGDSQEGLIP